MGQEIRILLVDDQSLLRESLRRLLQDEPGFQIVGSCASLKEALAAVEREQVHLVLLDYDVEKEQVSDFLEQAKKLGYEGRILLMSDGISGGAVLSALERGTSGIFMKDSPPSDLVKAIHRVAGGEVWLDSEAVKAMVEAARSGEHRVLQSLSGRERTVLNLVLEGLTNPEIAVKLQISESSVKWVIQGLFKKAGARTRSQLVRIALEKHTRDWLPAL
jgi:two-component system, NarL family, nitrate/nitrite response regulator NarL